MNVKMNSLFFVKNTISKVKTIKQVNIIMNSTRRNQSNCILRKRVIIYLSNFIKLIFYSNKRVPKKVIDLMILLVILNFQGYKKGGGHW